ncbi:MAG: transcriptional repressor [Anaerolineales bacterium]|nr:transcriptional repressor [Anaerolineales bacterium]MCB9431677.1 transcriptional repressor [Ardenticatenaceae bacterium]
MNNKIPDLTHIRELGFRVTPQRRFILNALAKQDGHTTATDIYQIAQKEMPTLNQATIYRVLDFFCGLNLVTRSDIGGRVVYEFAPDTPHHHLICRHCEQVTVLDDAHFEDLAAHLLAEHGFKADFNHLAIYGVCAHCWDKSM